MIIKPTITGNFTMLPNSYIRDKGLSFQAVGLCAYLLSLPKEWHISLEQICENLSISKNTMYKYLKELISAGVLQKARIKDEKGQFVKEGVYSFVLDSSENVESNASENVAESSQNIKQDLSQNTNKITAQNDKSTSQNLGSGFAEKKDEEALECGTLSTSQNLNSNKYNNINKKNNINNTKLDSSLEAKKSKNAKTSQIHHYILQTDEQKRLFSLCFAKAPKEQVLDLSALNDREQNAFKRFIDYRKEKGHLTISTKKAILAQCKRLIIAGVDLEKSVELSIMRGYRGLFEVREPKFQTIGGIGRSGYVKQKSAREISQEIMRGIITQYPNYDFVDLRGFLAKNLVNGKRAVFNNGEFSYETSLA